MKLRLGLDRLGEEEGGTQSVRPPPPPQAIYLMTDRNEIVATENGDQLVVETDHGQ